MFTHTHTHTHTQQTKLKGKLKKFGQKVFVFLLIFSLLFSQFSFLIPRVQAASSPWTQTDWSGGSGQTSWSDATKFDSSSNVTTSTAGQATLTATSGWCNNSYCNSSWAYRKKITFNNTDANLGVTSENLTNFPVLVKLSSSNIDYSKTQNNGEDIRFTDTDGSDLAYEIEKWDETGNSWVWVKVPQIDINSSTDYIYLYYGNTSATDHQQATSVWDSNYVMVQHLAETSGTTTNDSTSNNNDGTKVTATDPNPTTSGKINGAQSFDGSNDSIDLNNPTSLTGITNFTTSAWIKSSTTISSQKGIVANSYGKTQLVVGSTKKAIIHFKATDNSFPGVSSTTNVDDSQWYHLTGTWDGTTLRIYVNGLQENSSAPGKTQKSTDCDYSIGSVTTPACSGGDAYNDQRFPGTIDEARISNTARSAAYIAASYKSETDAFNSFASEEQIYSSTPGTLTSSIFDTEYTAGAAWGTLTYNATTPSNTSVSVKARTSNSSSMTGATAFSSCDAITSSSDISSNNCVTDSHRYIQYQLTLANTDSVSTPTFQDVSIAFSTYDADAPSISLTALSPDLNSDNTPTLSGTATESIGTISNVQLQMDATSGSWTACTANDGSFDEATETFTCTPSTALTDGSHTMYVRATDSNSNTTASGSESSDTFTIDATKPVSIDLDSPGDNSYTSNERPSFKWKATTDATAGLSKYVLEIDNPSAGSGQASGDFTIDDIPISRTTNYETNKYVIKYDGFSDSDSNNNYISVHTKSSNEWSTDSNSGQNEGKLREGKVSWKVKARDNAGNETSSSSTLFVDKTGPKVEFTQVNDSPFSSNNFSTTDKAPTIYGKITDLLSGGDSSKAQDDNGPKVASGPKQVDIKVEKKEGLGYKLITLYTINMDKPWYTCGNSEVSDNSKQKCDKYLPFEYTSKDNLDLGTYKITISGKDKADNTSGETTLTLNIITFAQITTPEEKKIIEEETKPLAPEQKEKVEEELEITKPVEPGALEKTVYKVTTGGKSVFDTVTGFLGKVSSEIGHGVQVAFNTVGQGVSYAFNKTSQALAFVGDKAGNVITYLGQKANESVFLIAQGVSDTAQSVGNGYNQLAENAPGVAKTILTGIGNGVSATAHSIAQATNTVVISTATLANNLGTAVTNTAKTIASATQNTVGSAKQGISGVAFKVGEKTQDVSDTAGLAIIRFTYNFVSEPTRIHDVAKIVLSPTSVKITWETNHPANGKVNWGFADGDYDFEMQTEKRTTHHEFILTSLEPDTEYHYEVMSHNKNYVYDANRKFKTLPLENGGDQ